MLYNGRSIDASYHVSVHLAKRFQRRFLRNRPITNKNCLWWPYLQLDWDEMSNIHREASIEASYQVSIHLAKQFQRRTFLRNRPIINKNCLWRPCLLTDQNEMSNLHREASYQVSIHLAKRFQRRTFLRNRPIINKNCLWRPCLLTDQNEMSILHKGPSIHASYQVSIHLAKRFQRRFLRNQPIRNKNCLWWPCLNRSG